MRRPTLRGQRKRETTPRGSPTISSPRYSIPKGSFDPPAIIFTCPNVAPSASRHPQHSSQIPMTTFGSSDPCGSGSQGLVLVRHPRRAVLPLCTTPCVLRRCVGGSGRNRERFFRIIVAGGDRGSERTKRQGSEPNCSEGQRGTARHWKAACRCLCLRGIALHAH